MLILGLMDSQKRKALIKRAVLLASIFVFIAFGLWYQKHVERVQAQEIAGLKEALFEVIESNVVSKGGKNFVLNNLENIKFERNTAVFLARYAFDNLIDANEATTTEVETEVVVSRVDGNKWSFEKLQNFKENVSFLSGDVISGAPGSTVEE